jgi:hypothetical protein
MNRIGFEGAFRDNQGRSSAGNGHRPGPFAARVAELRRRMLAQLTEDHFRQIARKLLERAQQGDVAAAKLLLRYILGRPRQWPSSNEPRS